MNKINSRKCYLKKQTFVILDENYEENKVWTPSEMI